jgi:hypothetical protein
MKKRLTGPEIDHPFRQICNVSSPSCLVPFLHLSEGVLKTYFARTFPPAADVYQHLPFSIHGNTLS